MIYAYCILLTLNVITWVLSIISGEPLAIEVLFIMWVILLISTAILHFTREREYCYLIAFSHATGNKRLLITLSKPIADKHDILDQEFKIREDTDYKNPCILSYQLVSKR